jgi:hypothetical protein
MRGNVMMHVLQNHRRSGLFNLKLWVSIAFFLLSAAHFAFARSNAPDDSGNYIKSWMTTDLVKDYIICEAIDEAFRDINVEFYVYPVSGRGPGGIGHSLSKFLMVHQRVYKLFGWPVGQKPDPQCLLKSSHY